MFFNVYYKNVYFNVKHVVGYIHFLNTSTYRVVDSNLV